MYDLLKRNPAALESVKSVEQLRSALPTLEQAVSMMRAHFAAHPPEETEPYRRNMEVIGNPKHDSKFWEVTPLRLSEKDAEEAGDCLVSPGRELAVIKVPPFYRLFLVEAEGGFKVATLICTEPPCVD